MAKTFLLALDAGHWIGEPGRRCLEQYDKNETREWTLNDRVSDYIAQRAAMYEGFKTMRVDDPTGKTEVSLAERCRRANNAGAKLYLSNHHNGGINGGSGGGVEAFSYPGSSAAAAWRDALYNAVIAAGGLKGNRANPKTTANFHVLRETSMNAVLIEYGFMDSRTDIPVITTAKYAKAVGYAVADCIAAREGLVLKEDIDMSKFKDVADNAWYAKSVDYCVEHGLMNGTSADKFEPDKPLTRAQAASLMERLHKMLSK